MPKPYSYDLRQKVIQAIKREGMKKSEVSQLFKEGVIMPDGSQYKSSVSDRQ